MINSEAAFLIARVECLSLNTQYVRTSFVKAVELCGDRQMVACEIGVFEGINSLHMLLAREDIKLFLIDGWDNLVAYTGGPLQGESYCKMVRNAAIFNLAGFNEKIYFTNKNSADSVKDFEDNFFDYVYIDGDHLYEAVLADMCMWWPKVKVGGIMGGHDVGMLEVSNALAAFVKENNLTNWDREDARPNFSDWWIYK